MATKTTKRLKRTAIRVRKEGNAYVAHHPQHPTKWGAGVTRQDAINTCWEHLQDDGVYMAIPNWHQPRNEACPNNANAKHPCTCKRPMKRKPFRVCRVHDKTVPRKCKRDIVFEVHPNGVMVFREKGRSTKYETTAGAIYERLQTQECQRLSRLKKLLKQTTRKRRK